MHWQNLSEATIFGILESDEGLQHTGEDLALVNCANFSPFQLLAQ